MGILQCNLNVIDIVFDILIIARTAPKQSVLPDIITVDNLVQVYADGTKAVDGISFKVQEGEFFGFLGPNGAGKSTTIKILTTLLRKTSGSATVAGFHLERQAEEIRKIIGVEAQETVVDPDLTGRENLMLQGHFHQMAHDTLQKRVDELLKLVELTDVAGRRAGHYSGGMKKRLDLASALVHKPRLLFLDEPTTGLDPASRAKVWAEVRRLNQELGMTIFLTTQYLEEADRLADEVAIIDRGRIVAQGAPRSLKKAIGNEVVTLSFATEESAARASTVLERLCPDRRLAGRDLLCYFGTAAGRLPELVRTLDEAGVGLEGLTVSEPTLDDVFLQATGHRMGPRDQGADPGRPDEETKGRRS